MPPITLPVPSQPFSAYSPEHSGASLHGPHLVGFSPASPSALLYSHTELGRSDKTLRKASISPIIIVATISQEATATKICIMIRRHRPVLQVEPPADAKTLSLFTRHF
jgi:hypothetical protein